MPAPKDGTVTATEVFIFAGAVHARATALDCVRRFQAICSATAERRDDQILSRHLAAGPAGAIGGAGFSANAHRRVGAGTAITRRTGFSGSAAAEEMIGNTRMRPIDGEQGRASGVVRRERCGPICFAFSPASRQAGGCRLVLAADFRQRRKQAPLRGAWLPKAFALHHPKLGLNALELSRLPLCMRW